MKATTVVSVLVASGCVVVVCVGLMVPFAYGQERARVPAFENGGFLVIGSDSDITVRSKSKPISIKIDNSSWTGGVEVTYQIMPTNGTKFRWLSDLDSDGEFDVRGVREDGEGPAQASVECRVGMEWLKVKGIDKAQKTATIMDDNSIIELVIGQGWVRKN